MPRLFSTILVLGLLGGTAAAFAVTEGLKLRKVPIFGTRVDKTFSPVCECAKRRAHVGFFLRSADRVTLAIVDGSGSVVRTLVHGERLARGRHTFTWNGRDDSGMLLPDGAYKPRVHLADAHRTILLPNPIRIDIQAPRIVALGASPRVISPDGDERSDGVKVRYRVSEPAHAILYVNGKLRAQTRFYPLSGHIDWYGRAGGRALRRGTYRLELRAVDLAGNLGPRVAAGTVRIRYVELARHRIRARAGTRFGVRVSADARGLAWRLGKRAGRTRPGLLVLRAPARPGRYTLTVLDADRADRAIVLVRR